MGKELDDSSVEPCLCGQGHFVVERWISDHAFPTKPVVKLKIVCSTCEQNFTIVDQDGHRCVVSNSDVAQRDLLQVQAADLAQNIRDHPKAEALMSAVATALRSESKKAGKYRLLHAFKLTHDTQETFTRNWNGEERWLWMHGSPRYYIQFGQLVGGLDPELESDLKAWEAAEQAANYSLPVKRTLPDS